MMEEFEARIKAIEDRLRTVEETLKTRQTVPRPVSSSVVIPHPTPQPIRAITPAATPTTGATEILGWGSVAALILAASYVIRLAVSVGWLTPVRQVVLAALFGATLIGIGFGLKEKNPRYASFLPGAGLVILFLSDYGGHLYYNLLTPIEAIVGIMLICSAALILGRFFNGELYPLVAVIGSYSSPVLLKTFQQDPFDLSIYFSAWSLLYCWYAIKVGLRRVYLLAAYLALIIFDNAWRSGNPEYWEGAITFQLVQFCLFSATTAYFSVVHKVPLEMRSVKSHLPILIIFYFLQYTTLLQHLPAWAPWIACWSFAVLLGIYALMKAYFAQMGASRFIIAIYGAVVMFHAVYLELLPDQTRPWVSLGLILAIALLARTRTEHIFNWSPLFFTAIIVFVISDGRLFLSWETHEIPGHKILLPLYAVALYVGYSLLQGQLEMAPFSPWLLYMGHANTMVAASQLLHGRLAISLIWGVLAVATLLIATQISNKGLGQSALFVFAAFAIKVWLFDLSGTDPLVRIGCLLVLGTSLYVGGLLYQKIDKLPNPTVSN
ncbi:MAG: DUF2339 domain-containing protein [Nitrospira sp.]|nr:DUF2339 domain-containing protein [Nitrospira sp.]